MRILVAEDEEVLAEAIARGLRREGFAVDVALDGDDALAKASVNDYDVVLLDRDLPVVHGDDVCRALVDAGREARILMLTASGTVADRVEGFGLGADDYLPKPFAFVELVARVRALARRPPPLPPVLKVADVELDAGRRRVSRGGTDIVLAPKEFAVLVEIPDHDAVHDGQQHTPGEEERRAVQRSETDPQRRANVQPRENRHGIW